MRLVLACALVLSTACGGKVGGDTDDGGNDSSTTSWSPVCPDARPIVGASCTTEGVDCEYGCSDVVVCSDGTWAEPPSSLSETDCIFQPNPPGCPSDFTTAVGACTNDALTCRYAQGLCGCNSPEDPTPDAGDTWFCGPESGCPALRPRLGTSCNAPNERCDYQLCGDSVECTNGLWQLAIGECGA